MANIIEEIIKRLQRVNHIIASRTNVSDITFADACVIAQFYHDYQNTNIIIDDVEDLVRQDGRTLYECATDLKKEVDKFVSLDLSAWNASDFINMEQSHLKEYKERWDAAKDKATNLWREYQTESNRLDMMDLNSEEFKTLDAQCDNTKLAYDKAHKQGEELYGIYDTFRPRVSGVELVLAHITLSLVPNVVELRAFDNHREIFVFYGQQFHLYSF